ncbi:hypothetical protein GNF76_21945 [Pseudomonas sp. CCM 7893]|uniref:Uncharacterized protein n=1 Tax=Pseudomonas spelaei TaxID=1055469 RepID=A0A6I3W8K3_9PSED|nr:hypothetical protein [Pseudomonas spelaei]MUF07020.1 hypothetical protein [Pseudomonas spelaei]
MNYNFSTARSLSPSFYEHHQNTSCENCNSNQPASLNNKPDSFNPPAGTSKRSTHPDAMQIPLSDLGLAPHTPPLQKKRTSLDNTQSSALKNLDSITPRDLQLYNKLDGKPPITAEEKLAHTKFENIENEIKKLLTAEDSQENTQLNSHTKDLLKILANKGDLTQKELDVMNKMYEAAPENFTLEERIISIKLNLMGV